ncbi:MAG: 6-bladed beta-propeller, partial [Chitinophagaceae bacterium]
MRSSLKDSTNLLLFLLFIPSIGFSQIQKIYLQPKPVGNANQSNFVESIRFIPLEIRENSNLAAFANIQVTEKYFLLIDYGEKSVWVYAKDGRYIHKISYKKLGEQFYPNYKKETNALVFFASNKNYALTPKDLIRIRLDWNNPRNKKYFKKYRVDLNDTTFTMKKESIDENDIVQAYRFFENYYLQGRISTSLLYEAGEDHELKIYKDKKLVKSYFPYDRRNEPRFLFTEENIGFNNTDTPSVQIITRPYCDTIYKMIIDSIVPAYQVVMPLENSLQPSFFT